MERLENFYSKSELAEKLGVSIRTIDNWIAIGMIGFSKVGRRIFFSQSDLDQLIENSHREAFYYAKELIH